MILPLPIFKGSLRLRSGQALRSLRSLRMTKVIMPTKDIKNKTEKKSVHPVKSATKSRGVRAEPEQFNRVKKTDKFIRAVGRRKSAVAQTRLYPKGKGKIEINQKDYKEYFPYFELNQKITAPLKAVGKRNDFSFTIKVKGGGKLGQAEACQLGIARCIVKFNEKDYKKTLRAHGFLTRDSRIKERKKPGLKKARRAPQWQKR